MEEVTLPRENLLVTDRILIPEQLGFPLSLPDFFLHWRTMRAEITERSWNSLGKLPLRNQLWMRAPQKQVSM